MPRAQAHVGKLVGGQERTARAVEHVVEAVLAGLHDDVPPLAAQVQVGEHEFLGAVEVPAIAGRRLIEPGHGAVGRMDGYDRGRIQLVAAAAAAERHVVRSGVAGADIDQVERGVIGHAVPDGAAGSGAPGMLGVPGLERRDEMRLLLRARGRIARHREEAPAQSAGVSIVCGHIAANPRKVRAAVADDHQVAGELRRAGDGVGLARVTPDQGVDLPFDPAGAGIDRMQPAVDRADVQSALEGRDAAIDGVATGIAGPAAVDVRVVGPKRLAGGGIDRIDAAEIAGGIHHAVDDQRRRLLATAGSQPIVPGEAELADVGRLDVVERGKIGAVGVATRRHPAVGIGFREPRGVDVRGGDLYSRGAGVRRFAGRRRGAGHDHDHGGGQRGDRRLEIPSRHPRLPYWTRTPQLQG